MIFQVRITNFCIVTIFRSHTKYTMATRIATATNIKKLRLNSFISIASEIVNTKYRNQHVWRIKMTKNIFLITGQDLFKMDNLLFQVTNFLQYKCLVFGITHIHIYQFIFFTDNHRIAAAFSHKITCGCQCC